MKSIVITDMKSTVVKGYAKTKKAFWPRLIIFKTGHAQLHMMLLECNVTPQR